MTAQTSSTEHTLLPGDGSLSARYFTLQEQLADLCRAYYTPEDTDIETPDSVYDLLLEEVRTLERSDPVLKFVYEKSTGTPSQTEQVGSGTVVDGVRHPTPMLSLDNVHSDGDLKDFLERLERAVGTITSAPVFMLEHKFDGLSCNLVYENGVFTRALTRGMNGLGSDITEQLLAIGIPLTVTGPAAEGTLEVRGEVLLPKAALDEVNAERRRDGKEPVKNARNAAAGLIRKNGPLSRLLSFMAYGVGLQGNMHHTSHDVQINTLGLMGFNTGPCVRAGTLEQIGTFHRSTEASRNDLPYDVDGTVVKLDDLALRTEAGFTSRAPRWATAYKFRPDLYPTLLLDIQVEVGKSGSLAPTAILSPVEVDGSTVSRATLNNQAFIDKLDLRVGDTVLIGKAGGVIPEIAGHKPGSERGPVPFIFPLTCPSCGGETVKEEKKAARRCVNDACPGRAFKRLVFFVSRECMDIKGFGESILKALFDQDIVKDASGLYTLDQATLAGLKTEDDTGKARLLGDKTAATLLARTEESKTRELKSVIQALGLRHTGKGTSKRVAAVARTLEGLLALSQEQLEKIDDVGAVTAESFYRELHGERIGGLIQRLVASGVSPAAASNARQGEGLAGLSFVFTGTLSQKRPVIESHVESHGGKASGSVTAKTSYLVYGEGGGGKAQTAREKGVKAITEEEFNALLTERGVPTL